MNHMKAAYSRILVKLSGEALLGQGDYGVDPLVLKRIAGELHEIVQMQVQLAVVIGGGNIFRGAGLARAGMDRVAADHMGMLATVMNALAMQDGLESLGMHARVMSAIRINEVCEDYIRRRAMRHLEKGRVTIFAAGSGAARDRDQRGCAAEGDQGERRVLGRPAAQPAGGALRAAHFRQGAVRPAQCHGRDRHRHVPR
jgi:hypothetical protein